MSTEREKSPLDNEDLDSGEQIVRNPWNRIVAIRGSRTARNSPRILAGCWCNGDTRINQGRPLPADEKLRNDGLDHQAGRATRLRFTGIVRGMLTVSGIQIVSIAATRDNSSLHHAHSEESKCQSVKPGAHLQCLLPGKRHVPCHLQAYNPVGVSN